MHQKSRLNKGPRPTAEHAAQHKDRMTLRREQEAQDQAELTEFAEAFRAGDRARLLEIAKIREARSRGIAYPQGVVESETARAGRETDTPSSAHNPVSPAPFVVGAPVYHKTTHETGKLVELRRHTNNSPRWVVEWTENGERQLVWQVDLCLGTPPDERTVRKMQPSNYGRRHGADGKYITRKFAAEVDSISRRIRSAMADGEGGAA